MIVRRLFERHYPRLVRYLYRRLGDLDRAEDLAQEAFVRLLERRPRRPEAWLYAVAANLARDAARSDTRRARRLQILEGFAPDRAEPLGERAVARDETVARVRAALGALSERDRTLLLLRQEGLGYRALAETLGVASTSIGPLLARAQKRLLRAFEAAEGPQDEEGRARGTSI